MVRYIVFLCFPFSLVPVATAILGGELLWTSVSPLVSDCGREGPLFAVLGVFAGLRLWLLVLSTLLARLLWHAWLPWLLFGILIVSVCVEFFLDSWGGILLIHCSCYGTDLLGRSACLERNVGPGGFSSRFFLSNFAWPLGWPCVPPVCFLVLPLF